MTLQEALHTSSTSQIIAPRRQERKGNIFFPNLAHFAASRERFSDSVGSLPLLQHPVALMCGDSFLAVANYIAQHGLCVTAEDGEFPPTRQFGVGEMERKTGEHDRPQPWILDGDNESAVF